MNITRLQKVLTIVSKYVNPETEWVEAQHDIIFLPLFENAKISTEDLAELDELGAFISSDSDCWAVHT